MPAVYRTCHSSPLSLYQPQIHLLCLCACYRRNDKRQHSSPTNERTRWTCVSTRRWTCSLPAGLLSAMIRCFCHVKIVYSVYSWIWSLGCTDNFLILKEKQCLRNLFYCFQFYLENDKVKAHVGTSSPWALIWKWNVNFRWIPTSSQLFFLASCSFFHLSFLSISSGATNTDGSNHGTDEKEMVSMCFLCMSLNLSQH